MGKDKFPAAVSVEELLDKSEAPSAYFTYLINNPENSDNKAGEMGSGHEWQMFQDFRQIYREVEGSSYRAIHSIVEQKFKGKEMEYLRTFLIASAKDINQLKDVLYGIELKGASREKPYQWDELAFLINACEENPESLSAIPRAMNLRDKVKELLQA